MKQRSAIGVILVVLAACCFYVFFINPWSELWCLHEDINIKTGQAREIRMILFMPVYTKVKDTPISLALGGKSVNAAPIEPWHRVNTFGPNIRYSPHYRFHSALARARELSLIFESRQSSAAEKREIAEKVLSLWQTGGNDYAADDYISSLYPK